MSKVVISEKKVAAILKKSPKSLTEIYRLLGGSGKLSGSVATRLRDSVPRLEAILAKNKAKTSKSPPKVVPPKAKPAKKASKATKYPRHPKNPFRPQSGYSLLLDIISASGSKGIGRENLLQDYCKASGKDLKHAKYDLAVINSAQEGGNRHKSAKDGFTIIKTVDNFRIKFD